MALPDVPLPPDMVAAVLVQEEAVLFMRHRAHTGAYYVLPSGRVAEGESLEQACQRVALNTIRVAATELGNQIKTDLVAESMQLSVGDAICEHTWNRGETYHYFLVRSNDASLLGGPRSIPSIEGHTFVWMPFEWIPLNQVAAKTIEPKGAIDACQFVAQMRSHG